MNETIIKDNSRVLPIGAEIAPIAFNIQSNEDIINVINNLLNLYARGEITDKQLKAFSYPFQLMQSSLKARDVDAKIKFLFTQIEALKRG